MRCNQAGCDTVAAFLYCWPGARVAPICEQHHSWAQEVAKAMGFELQSFELMCSDLMLVVKTTKGQADGKQG